MTPRSLPATALLVLLLVPSARAAVRRVPLDHATIGAALAAAAPGDTVLVGPGTYSPAANGEVFPLAMSKNAIRLIGAGMDQTVVDAQGTAGVIVHTAGIGGRVSGFTLTGGAAYEGGGVNVLAGDVELDHLRFLHDGASAGGGAVSVRNNSAPWIHHNLFLDSYSTSAADVHALRLNTRVGGLFEHNLLAHSDGNGLLTVDSVTTTVRNNIFYRNGIPTPQRGRGICWLSEVPPRVRHNLFFENQVAALLWVGGGGDLSGSAANDFDANDLVYGNLDQDPLFTAPLAGDYHLQAGSPAIDSGDPSAPPDADGSIADIGPFARLPVAGVPPAAVAGMTLRAAPNPVRDGTGIRFLSRGREPARVSVWDAAGRIVRELAAGRFPPGEQRVDWDARDEAGAHVRPGLYFIRVTEGAADATIRVVVLR